MRYMNGNDHPVRRCVDRLEMPLFVFVPLGRAGVIFRFGQYIITLPCLHEVFRSAKEQRPGLLEIDRNIGQGDNSTMDAIS